MPKSKIIVSILALVAVIAIALPAYSITAIDRKQRRQINALRERIVSLEYQNENQSQNVNYLFERTQLLQGNGHYFGNVDKFQVVLPDGDVCVNGQPRAAQWDNSHLAC